MMKIKLLHIIIIISVVSSIFAGIGIITILGLMDENSSLKTELGTEKHYSSSLYNSSIERISNITKLGFDLNNLNQNYSELVSLHETLENNLTSMINKNLLLEIDNEKWHSFADETAETLQTVSKERLDLINENEKKSIELNLYKLILNETQKNVIILNKTITELKYEIKYIYKNNISDLQTKISISTNQINNLQIEINRLLTELNQPNTDLETLREEYDSLLDFYNTQIDDYNLLVAEYNALVDRESLLITKYDDLMEKWRIWQQHADLAPKARPEYHFEYYFDEWISITFPNADNCFVSWLLVDTEYMRPVIGVGHEIIGTTCFTENDLQAGDIIVFRYMGYDYVHQIIEIVPGGYVTKGMNDVWPDTEVIQFENIIAIIVAIIY